MTIEKKELLKNTISNESKKLNTSISVKIKKIYKSKKNNAP